MSEPTKLGRRLRELRDERRLTKNELSSLTRIGASSINMYERGEREPGLVTMEKLAEFFNVDMNYLTGTSDIRNSAPVVRVHDADDGLPEDEKRILFIYRNLSPGKKHFLTRILDELINV